MPLRVYCRTKDGDLLKKNICLHNEGVKITYKQHKKSNNFIVNKIWNTYYTNDTIFNELYSNCSHYYVSYWVAFGYTGSGKTYTTINILTNLLNHLLLSSQSDLYISALQIYDENILDLMNNNKKCKYFKTDKLIIKNESRIPITNVNDVIETITKNRTVASTIMNIDSSRSHALISIFHNKKKYVIVDMAGQEFGNINNKNYIIQKQANNINLNMLALKECILAYHSKQSYIPYRRTLLTLALKPLFEHNCNSAFICNISLNHTKYYQIDSLRYASTLYKTIKNNNEKNSHYNLIFNDLCNYIEDNEWCNFYEKDLRQEMKNGNFANIHQIENILNKKEKYISKLKRQIKSYEKL